ncbi:MAG: hypothetical protein HY350_02310 [Candidatus Omnitrophica bacterium]|nr:hypothetical protein [Candidatus Omnitrophota bacterium]
MFVFKDKAHKLELMVLDDNGDFVTGITVTYEIRKAADDTLVTSGTMTEENKVYTAGYTFTELGTYRVKYTTPTTYENGFENIVVVDEFAYDSIAAKDVTVAKEATLAVKASQTIVDAIKAKTDNLPSAPAAESSVTARPTLAQIEASTVLAKEATLGLVKAETDKIKRILGLAQENFKLYEAVYSNRLLTSGKIKIYSSAADLQNDVNPIATYQITAAYNEDGTCSSYKLERTA